ncbi:MAG: cytochrome b N-terminal domain-containing protein [Kofleriaceae bacterium]
MALKDALRERLGTSSPQMMPGGASIAHVFGTVLVFLLALQAVTGIALAAFYSPSSTDAWASVAYVQDQASMGWLVRGLHHHGGSAMVIITGIHLLQTAVAGAYKKPRELVWWLGLLLLALLLAWTITGFWLRWDQSAYWASQVELGIAAGAPVIGATLKSVALGGNEAGNLTLTRAYALHVAGLPILVALVTLAHVVLARRHGPVPMRKVKHASPRWPDQTIRDVIAMAIVFSILLAYVISVGGVGLDAPADPGASFDARPMWPFRWLFEARALGGAAETLVALGAPAIVAGFLISLPLLDRGPDRAPRKRVVWLGGLAGMFAVIGALTIMSFARDANDDQLAKRQAIADKQAAKARRMAMTYGVPVTGPLDVYTAAPFSVARTLFEQRCSGCHDEKSEKRKGPIIGAGHKNRAWLTAFLRDPSGPAFWGLTKLAKTEDAMKPVDLPAADLADVVEFLYSMSSAADVDAAKRDRGITVFDGACSDCHSREEGVSGTAPALAGLGSREYYFSFIGNPKSGLHMGGGERSQMPRFDRELTLAERDELAAYMVWLRTATPMDMAAQAAAD